MREMPGLWRGEVMMNYTGTLGYGGARVWRYRVGIVTDLQLYI